MPGCLSQGIPGRPRGRGASSLVWDDRSGRHGFGGLANGHPTSLTVYEFGRLLLLRLPGRALVVFVHALLIFGRRGKDHLTAKRALFPGDAGW